MFFDREGLAKKFSGTSSELGDMLESRLSMAISDDRSDDHMGSVQRFDSRADSNFRIDSNFRGL